MSDPIDALVAARREAARLGVPMLDDRILFAYEEVRGPQLLAAHAAEVDALRRRHHREIGAHLAGQHDHADDCAACSIRDDDREVIAQLREELEALKDAGADLDRQALLETIAAGDDERDALRKKLEEAHVRLNRHRRHALPDLQAEYDALRQDIRAAIEYGLGECHHEAEICDACLADAMLLEIRPVLDAFAAVRAELDLHRRGECICKTEQDAGCPQHGERAVELSRARAELDEATKRITDTLSDLDDYIRDTDGITGEEVISDAIKTLRGQWQPAPAAGDTAGQDGAV